MRFSVPTAVGIALCLLVGCDRTNPAGPDEISSADVLIDRLQQQGASVVRAELMPVESNPYFSVRAQRILINGGSSNVFEYASPTDANRDAAQVPADGSTIGTTQITWVSSPHFYRNGRLIVLYVGSDVAVLQPLDTVLGKPFGA